jgi:hypothetical protein
MKFLTITLFCIFVKHSFGQSSTTTAAAVGERSTTSALNKFLDCHTAQANIKNADGSSAPTLPLNTKTCDNYETYCVTMTGNDKTSSGSAPFTYRGCYSDLLKMDQYYGHVPQCNATMSGGHFTNGAVTGDLTCCTTSLCNFATISSVSPFSLFLISIFALFYSISG